LERTLLDTISENEKPKNILVIGAGAFTFGIKDHVNIYDFVDIDKDLKNISEKYILKQKLTKNKHFHPMEARAFLAANKNQYDLILLDAYTGDYTIPEHLVTRDFYLQVKRHLKKDGIVAANLIISPTFQSTFSRRIDSTFRSVFPFVSRIVVDGKYEPWTEDKNYVRNTIYIYRDNADDNLRAIYTDDKNTIFYDKPQSR
jgi:spermidine synthase